RLIAALAEFDVRLEVVHGQLAVEGKHESLAWIAAELPVRSYMYDIVGDPPQLGLKTRSAEGIVEQLFSSFDVVDCGHLTFDIREGYVALYTLGNAEDQRGSSRSAEWPRIREMEARSDGSRVTVHKETSPIVQCREWDGSQCVIRNQN